MESGTTGSAYVAVDELHRCSRVHLRRAVIPTAKCWTNDRDDLIRGVRSEFSRSTPVEREVDYPAPAVPATFLYTVLSAVRSAGRKTSHVYVHNGKRYQLQCEKSAGRVTGHIRDLETSRVSTFRLWMEEAGDLPERIEFSPRSYLRISLEREKEEM